MNLNPVGKIFVSLFPKQKPQGYFETEYVVGLPPEFDPSKEYSGKDLIQERSRFVKCEPIPWENATVFNYLTRTGAYSDWPVWWKRGN